MPWEKELEILLNKEHTFSDVVDFIEEHSDVPGKQVWNYVYKHYAPVVCRGCKHIQMKGLYPCSKCSRQPDVKDYYEKEGEEK